MKKLTSDEFIYRAKNIHGETYDYSSTNYINSRKIVGIKCKIHGYFEVLPSVHLRGSKCRQCVNNNYKMNNEIFIDKAKLIHGNIYNYDLVEYINNHEKIKIICKIHGIFEQSPNAHLCKDGCPSCGGTKKLTIEDFIKKSNKTHNNKYDYSLVKYINYTTNVEIICPEHGVFIQKPSVHNKSGCQICNESRGETNISLYLDKYNIEYIKQKTFSNCRDIRVLPFDFYLPSLNTCIEFYGLQHFKSIPSWGGKNNFKKIIKHDKIKNEYCKEYNIHLIRIKYNENIEKILTKLHRLV